VSTRSKQERKSKSEKLNLRGDIFGEEKSIVSVIVKIFCIVIIVVSIPFIIGIGLMLNGDAQRNMEYTYAATIDNACKSYYSDIMIGKTENRDGEKNAVPLFPEQGKSESERKEFAFSRTINDALKYIGTENYLSYLDICVADNEGNIYWKSDKKIDETNLQDISLNSDTTLGELYHNKKDYP